MKSQALGSLLVRSPIDPGSDFNPATLVLASDNLPTSLNFSFFCSMELIGLS